MVSENNEVSGTIVIDVNDILMNNATNEYIKEITCQMFARKMVEVVKNPHNFPMNYNHYGELSRNYSDMQKLDQDYEDAMASLLSNYSYLNKDRLIRVYGKGMMRDISKILESDNYDAFNVIDLNKKLK